MSSRQTLQRGGRVKGIRWEGEDNSLQTHMNLEDKNSGWLLENSQDILMEMKWEREEREIKKEQIKQYYSGRRG